MEHVMKNKSLNILVLMVTVMGCGKSIPSADNVKIGMTYDEVENLFGKPSSIVKGVTWIKGVETEEYTELNECMKSLHPAEALELRRSVIQLMQNDSTISTSKPEIDQQGQLIQTTWYLPTSHAKDTTIAEKTLALDSVKATRYWESYASRNNRVWERIPASYYRRYIDMMAYKSDVGPVPTVVVKPVKYKVHTVFAIVFDSSSGRVSAFGYLPTAVEKLPAK
jgi:hypothetical protein